MPEEEARVETAHVAVANGASVDDILFDHLVARFCCLVLVDPEDATPYNDVSFCVCPTQRRRCGGDGSLTNPAASNASPQ